MRVATLVALALLLAGCSTPTDPREGLEGTWYWEGFPRVDRTQQPACLHPQSSTLTLLRDDRMVWVLTEDSRSEIPQDSCLGGGTLYTESITYEGSWWPVEWTDARYLALTVERFAQEGVTYGYGGDAPYQSSALVDFTLEPQIGLGEDASGPVLFVAGHGLHRRQR